MLTPSIELLRDAVDPDRVRQPRHLEHRRQHVDHVVPLVAHLAAGRDAGRPVHDDPVAGAAVVRGDLLGPLVRRVHRQRPADRVDRVRRRVAEAVEPGVHRVHVVGEAVADEVLGQRALGPALPRRAVVAEQVEHQRVLEDAEAVQRVDEPADVVVRVLGEAGVGLHEPGRHLAGLGVELVPVRHARAPTARAPCPAGRSRAPSAGPGSSRARRPSRRRTGRRTGRATPAARGTARASRPARGRRRTACPGSAPAAWRPSRRRGRRGPR